MEATATVNKVKEAGYIMAGLIIKGVSKVLDTTAHGISNLSSMVKGEKKLIIRMEDTK
jgi:hypothetical protein